MLTKPDMWESEEFRMKFARIPKALQGQFLKVIQDLYRQESDSMMKFIQSSRKSLRITGSEIKDEQEVLQLTSKKLSQERSKNRIDADKNPYGRQDRANLSSRSYPPQARKHKPYCPSPEPMAQRHHPVPQPGATMHYENEEYDDEDDDEFFKEETNEILRATSRAEQVHATERARQSERVEQLKKQRQAKKEAHEDHAHELIREASMLEKQKSDEKKKQEEAVKAKLQERRRQKEMTSLGVDTGRGSTLPDVDVHTDRVRTPRTRSPATIDNDDPLAAAPDPPTEEPQSDKKKKKKKDKKKDKKSKVAIPSDSPV